MTVFRKHGKVLAIQSYVFGEYLKRAICRAKCFISIISFNPLLNPKTREYIDPSWCRRKLKVPEVAGVGCRTWSANFKAHVWPLCCAQKIIACYNHQPLKKEAHKKTPRSTRSASSSSCLGGAVFIFLYFPKLLKEAFSRFKPFSLRWRFSLNERRLPLTDYPGVCIKTNKKSFFLNNNGSDTLLFLELACV